MAAAIIKAAAGGMFHVKQFLRLIEFCRTNNLDLDISKQEQFDLFCGHLLEKNKVMNLTAIIDTEDVEIRHFIDSLESAPVIKKLYENSPDNCRSMNITDLGTGAGFPGIPLAILFPQIHFTLADSLEKRIRFLDECLNICKIKNVSLIHGRAEDLGQNLLRETSDICVSRAVAAMPVLLEYCLPLVKTGGKAILYKSGAYKQELESAENALNILGGSIEDIKEFRLPGSDAERSLIIISKNREIPEKYPRKAGKPAKSPL